MNNFLIKFQELKLCMLIRLLTKRFGKNNNSSTKSKNRYSKISKPTTFLNICVFNQVNCVRKAKNTKKTVKII